MPILAILGLAFSALRIVINIVALVRAHNALPEDAKAKADALQARAESLYKHMQDMHDTLDLSKEVQSP